LVKKERTRERILKNLQKTRPEYKVASLMLREHMINIVETVTKKEPLRNCKGSLVISWLGTGVAKVIRMNAYAPMVGWKGEHPQSVGR
jgi:hypothetical protein